MMEIETFSCLRSPPQKVPLNPLESAYISLPNMVVDLQSQNTCAVPADTSLHNSSHDFKYMPPEGSNHTSPHDFKLLPPEGVVTPSPDNPPTIDSSDIPNDMSYNEAPDGYQSPPNLSPKTVDEEMEDRDCSPSQSPDKHRSRRKPTLEDIVRRMKEVENSESENSESEGEDEKFNGSMIGPLTIDMQRTGGENADCEADEVDGDAILPGYIPNINRNFIKENGLVSVVEAALQMLPQPLIKDGMSLQVGKSLLENGNDMEQGCERNEVLNDSKHSPSKESESLDISMDSENIQPESDKNRAIQSDKHIDSTVKDMMDRITEMTNSAHKMYDSPSTPKLNGWGIHGAFHNSLPLFPFPPSPLEHHLAPNFLPMFDGKFPVQMEHEKDYLKCQYCERTFRRQKNLENHIENTHHGKGPQRRKSGENGTVGDMYFKCTHCPYTTKHQSNLYVHLRIHTGERPYICGACGVQYSQSHSLKSHIINKHDGIMSYYIKEKRNRSPRGMGYLSQVVPDISMYKIPGPMPTVVPTSMQQPSPQEQHTPLLMPQPKLLPPTPLSACFPSPKQHSPLQNVGHPQLSPQMGMDGIHLHLQTQGIHEHIQSQIHQQQHQHIQQQAQQQQQQTQQSKSSPVICNNGHLSPKYINSLLSQQLKPNQMNEEPLSLVTHHKSPSQMPLQDISNNPVHANEECGAIDLTKKSVVQDNHHHHDNQADSAIKVGHDLSMKCTDKDCINCVHQAKLRLLRLNVVRMLSILVPNLNFEEKGISADGDSVDELLHDVIESNMQEEEMRE